MKTNININIKKIPVIFSFVVFILFTGCDINYNNYSTPDNEILMKNLQGIWKFSIGDNMDWADPKFNDDDWEKIEVPSLWEDQGFHGYNGYAWYRKHFSVEENLDNKQFYLHLGFIDDVDEVYFNGQLIGKSGEFPPDYQTAYNAIRKYLIPDYLIKDGENVIAVRVYDSQLAGGIISGDQAIYFIENKIKPELNLSGVWKFKPGDDSDWKSINLNDSSWNNIIVPGNWEFQGYAELDGFAWYRKNFTIPQEFKNKWKDKNLILLLGKIDDYDQVYLNGELIGSTGDFSHQPDFAELGNVWLEQRGYFIPANVLFASDSITVAVRVYDGFNFGGIYEGPVGLISQSKYKEYWEEQRD